MVADLRLERLTFLAGARPGEPPLEVETPETIIFVGPNNSGKSLALREIEQWCLGVDAKRKVVGELTAIFPDDPDEGVALVELFKSEPPENQVEAPGHIWVGQHTFRPHEPVLHYQLQLDLVRNAIRSGDVAPLRQHLLKLYVIRLDGRTRFTLSDPKPTGDLQLHPQNHLWALFKDDPSRTRVRALTEEAFGLSFVIDPTNMHEFRIRLSDRPPADPAEEQALDARARTFHKGAPLISDLSDGVQAFTGLTSAVLSLPHKVLLIDEPEAFLHPPLARKLGGDLAALAARRRASLIVSTHSADFVMGCVESRPSTTIVRLTHRDGLPTARALPAAELGTLMNEPLLRSTGALRGLFHQAVVVAEADTDRAFYDEINRRLRDESRGIDDALFVNAQNWQTVAKLLKPLRALGIPAAGILDFDALRGSSTEWTRFWRASALDDTDRATLTSLHDVCRSHLAVAGPDQYKVQGLGAFNGAGLRDVKQLISQLASLGIFVVPVGAVEQWLAHLDGKEKKGWIVRIFKSLGPNPAAASYVRPAKDDVWRFLDSIAKWVGDPTRGGMA